MYECVDCLEGYALDEGFLIGDSCFRCNNCAIDIEVDIMLAQQSEHEEKENTKAFSTSRFLQEHGDDEALYYCSADVKK